MTLEFKKDSMVLFVRGYMVDIMSQVYWTQSSIHWA